jgi:Spherulation-specific family 4
MSQCSTFLLQVIVALWALDSISVGDDLPSAERRQRAQEFHYRAQQRTGLLVPLYVYPENVHKNSTYNRLIEVKRQHETVPVWVIVNPASGPGERVDGNYAKAIDRLCGAGCVALGYVTTSYGKRAPPQVQKDIDQWLKMYPRIQGIFFDEMIYEDTDAGAKYQATLNRYAHEAGCWPTVANPGADVPGRYFAADAADVIVVHEGENWPNEERLKGDYFGGYADYPPFLRGVLLHSQPTLDKAALRMVRKYARWIYVTDALYRVGEPNAANPWDRLSKHLEELCEELSH